MADREIKDKIHYFVAASRSEIVSGVDAIMNKDYSGLSSLHQRLSESSIVTNIGNIVNTSKAGMDEFFAAVTRILDDEALRFLVGGVLGGVGGGILAEAAGLAAVVGVSVLGAQLIAAILILVGLYLCGTAIWKKIKSMEFDWAAALKT